MNCQNKSRFCYSYKQPGLIESCCVPPVCATNEYLAQISSLSMVTSNSTKTSERSLLLYTLQQQQQCNQSVIINNAVQNTIVNNGIIASTIYGQLLQVRQQRYEPYQPYIPPVIPANVIQFQMATNNATIPHSFFTIADCKGVQSVTT